jgi:hypothetical protein
MGDGEEGPVFTGRLELELDRLSALERSPVEYALRQLREAGRLAGEDVEAGVEESVAARRLQLFGREERRLGPSFLRPLRLRGVELRQAGGLASQLLLRPVLRVVAEEPEGDQRRDEPGQRDPG